MDTTPRYAVVHHRITTPDGVTHKRTSIHRRYTYVVAAPSPKDADTWVIYSWHTTNDEALRAVARYNIDGTTHILPVTRMEQMEAIAA